MATRYATFQATPRVTSLQLATLVGNSAAVVSPGPDSTSFVVVQYDNTAANALTDLTQTMASLGYVFVVDSASAPTAAQYRDYGSLATAPVSPAPGGGDRYYNDGGKFLARYSGTNWIPEATPGLAVPLAEVAGTVAWDCAAAPRASLTITASGWTLSPTNMVVNGRYTLILTQDGTGNRTFTFPSNTRLCRGPTQGTGLSTVYEFTCLSAGVLSLTNNLGWRTKTVSGTTYTLTAQDHQTTLVFTSASNIALTGLSITGQQDFEFEILPYGAGQVTFTPAGGQLIYWDPGATGGSASWTTIPQFNTQRLFTDGSTGWFMR